MLNSNLPKQGQWAFVLNRFVIESELPFELAQNCFIQKATEDQRLRIKEVLSNKIGNDPSLPIEYF